MTAYSGPGNFPYWMTITNTGGVSGATALSENIPVTAGLNYQFQVVASFANTWASGAGLSLTFYDVNGNVLSTFTGAQANMSAGVLYQVNTGLVTAPASSSFAVAGIILEGNATSALSVYQAEIDDQNFNQVNINFAFTWTFWPWSPVNSSTTLGWAFSDFIAGDSDSLVFDGVIEVMGGIQGVQSDIPELLDSNGQGPTFRILAPPSLNSSGFGYEPSYDLNAPQPTQDVVASMLLDGERPFGERASNRTMSLPVIIFGTMAGGMQQVLRAREFLMSVIDQQTWQMKWTPADTGLAMIFDCFRALPSSVLYGFNYSAGGSATGQTIGRPNYPIAMITLAIQALPYGRSDIDGVQALSFNSPIANGVPTVSPTTVDTFGTVFNPPPVINTPNWTVLGLNNPSGVSTWTITASSQASQGATIVVEIEAAANTVTGVSDDSGNVYTLAGAQTTGGACWQYLFTAPVSTTLPTSGHITINASGSGSFSSVAYVLSGAWNPVVLFQGTHTTASFSSVFQASQYAMVLSVASGLGGSGSVPVGFNSLGANSGNGFNNLMAWFSQPINQTQVSVNIASSLPNPSSLMFFAFLPVNQFWSQDAISPPPTFAGKSVRYTPPRPFHMPWPAAVYSQTLQSPVNIAGNPVLSVMFGQSYDTSWPKDPKFVSNVTLRWTLTDNIGRTLIFSKAQKRVNYGTNPFSVRWTQINSAVPQGKAFNYNAVASYSVRITNWAASGHSGYVRMNCWLNNIVANPQTIQNTVSPRGSVYNLFSLPGSARAPVSVQCQLPASANISKEITAPSTGQWIVPPGVYSVQAETWAGGGAGAATNLARNICGGGGGGGEYAQEPALPVVPGQRVPWSIGAGGTPGQLVNTVIQYTRDGLGHWTCPANVTSVLAEVWGAGAAGGAGAGGGGGGEYARCRVAVTPGTTYSLWTGRGGKADTGTSSAQVAARQGAGSWFGPPNNQQGPTAFTMAKGGSTSLTGSSSGGYGGTSGTVAPQTQANLIASASPSANTSFTVSPNTGTKKLPAGDTGLITVTVPAAATITVTDTAKNIWTQVATASVAGAVTRVFACFTAFQLNAKSVITVKQSASQLATIGVFDIPWIVGQDAAFTAASGTSAAPSVTSNAPANAGDLVLAIFSSVTANTNSTPAGWTALTSLGTSLFTNAFTIQNPGTGTETATSSYAASQSWNGITLTLSTETHFAGGRGGTSPGPAGGGGGGAAGSAAAGGTGGDSLPFSLGSGRWAAGGTGGTGSGLGGNGGTGAGVPGFPGAGAQPGGGGGGGFQLSPLFNPGNPSLALPGQQQNNFLGADGGTGMVQLTYAVGSGSPVNGSNTTFGSAATTGTIVTANGGISAANNSAAGGAGGTGSANTVHNSGGTGGLTTSGTLGSYMQTPTASSTFQSLSTMTYSSTASTSGAAASSCAQGVAIALIESTAKVSDLQVTDSAGNVYQLQGVASAGAGGTGVTAYAYVANIEFPITTSTTLTASSATSQQYGVIWYASPWLVSGVSPGNSGSGNNTGTAFSAQFGVADSASIEIQLGVVLSDGSKTVSNLAQVKTWFNAGATNSLAAGTMTMNAYVMATQGGGTGSTGSGDIFSGTLTGSANWAALAVPLAMINQQAAMVQVDWRTGTTPGAQTTWASEAAISANGMLVVVGQCGSGAAITSGPSAIGDASGNVYTFKNTTLLPANGGAIFIATAPVTQALAAGTTGTVNWGHASAAPEYWMTTFWVPNAISVIDTNGVSAVTGSGTAVSGGYTPADPNDMVMSVVGVANATRPLFGGPGTPWNNVGVSFQAYLAGNIWVAQATDEAVVTFADTLSVTSPWALLLMGFQMQLAGTGGGAAGGPNGPGYPGVWTLGGPGFAGGGKGGAGAAPPPQAGNGASYPGGGGGGALGSSAAAQEGGQGAPGAIRLTWAPPLQTFNTLIVHSLGANSDPQVNPIVPIPITDVPNNTEYPVPSVNGLLPATFSSTYSVVLANFFWNSVTSASPRQITVTVNQYEFPGGPRYSVQVTRAVIPATDSVNGLLSMGEVTLPVKDYLAYNDQSYFTVSINDTDTGDRFMDVLFLDTLGQTVLINIDPGQAGFGSYVNFFIDEAPPDRDLGFIGASMQDRQHQVSVLDYAQSSGALYVGNGDNLFLVYSTSGSPDLAVNFAPRWYLDRSV